MYGIDWKPLTQPITLPCTAGLPIATGIVLAGILSAADEQTDTRGLLAYHDALLCYDTIHACCPQRVTIEQMLREVDRLVSAGLLLREGYRFRLAGLLIVDYVNYKATLTPAGGQPADEV